MSMAEGVTLIAPDDFDDTWTAASAVFSEKEIIELLIAISTTWLLAPISSLAEARSPASELNTGNGFTVTRPNRCQCGMPRSSLTPARSVWTKLL